MDPNRRKELKKAAKETTPEMGVFLIRNTANGRILIGSSMNLGGSSNSFHYKLDFFSHHNDLLKTDLARYGAAAFTFEVLEKIDAGKIDPADRADTVRMLEKKWRSELTSSGDKEYNDPASLTGA